jgi:CHAT domain-containing protein/Flp pilus assembly protein TadD
MKLSLALLFLLIGHLSNAQAAYQDSAQYYYDKGQYAKALPFGIKAVAAAEAGMKEDSLAVLSRYTLGAIYFGLARYDSAKKHYDAAAAGAKKWYGAASETYGRYLVDVGTMYRESGRLQEAAKVYDEAISILEKIDVPYRNSYAFSLIQKAMLYHLTGDYGKAEDLLLKAGAIAPHAPLEKKTEYALSLHELGRLYDRMRNYASQEKTQLLVLDMLKEMYGEDHPAYGSAINNLAVVYQRRKQWEKADSMFRKSLDIKKRANGTNSSAYIMVLSNIGIINTEMGRYDTAEKYLKENVAIAYSMGGEETLQYPFCLTGLARLYAWSGRPQLADSLFKRALAIYNKLGVKRNSNRLKQLYDMPRLIYANDSANAVIYLKEAVEVEQSLLLDKLEFMSEPELFTYVKGLETAMARPYMFLMKYKSPVITGLAYNNRLLVNGIGLQNTRVLYENMGLTAEKDIATAWKKYLNLKSSYNNYLLTPIAQRRVNMDSIAVLLNQLEKDLLRQSADYRNMKEKLSTTWQDIRRQLKPGEASIEFVRYAYKYDTYENSKADSVFYAALLIRSTDEAPHFISLLEEKELVAALNRYAYKSAVATRGIAGSKGLSSSGTGLFRTLWQPLEPFLSGIHTVYFAPDGLLHRIAFAAIPDQQGRLLCDKYSLVQLTSTAEVARRQEGSADLSSFALFGGINYNKEKALNSKTANRSAGSFSFLPNSLKEINAIKTLTGRSSKKTIAFTGYEATEEKFSSLKDSSSPEVIHFATHGFALPELADGEKRTGGAFKSSDNPLVRCGLAMSGANDGWNGLAAAVTDDGILTGLEISGVRLPDTKLAVLSACETGLGQVEGSEGVFGLQRAFKLAGVNYIMASLWQVPDSETARFMETFYSYLLGGKTIRAAFLATQQFMRQRYTPYYWAGFTLVQ